MPRAPVVVHQYGRPYKAKTLNGKWVERQDNIFVPSHREIYPVLDYDTHFVYRDGDNVGSTLLCTCGSPAGVVGYEGYKRFASYQGSEVIACMFYTNHGTHSDGSH